MSQPPEPTEQIYLSGPSPYPPLVAIGLAFVFAGLFTWWPYSVAGGLLAIGALIPWLRGNRDEIASMPNEQHTDTAPIPLR